MNVAELERLASGAPPEGKDCEEVIGCLARRVISAERLFEALREWESCFDTAALCEDDHPQADLADAWRLSRQVRGEWSEQR